MALCYKKTGCLQHSRLTVGLHNKTVAIKDTAALIVTELNPVTVSLSTNTMGMIQTICDFISPTWTSFRFHMDFISYSGSTAADESGLRRKKRPQPGGAGTALYSTRGVRLLGIRLTLVSELSLILMVTDKAWPQRNRRHTIPYHSTYQEAKGGTGSQTDTVYSIYKNKLCTSSCSLHELRINIVR